MFKFFTPHVAALQEIICNKIREHIEKNAKVTAISFISLNIPYQTYSQRALDVFKDFSNGVNISARWRNNDPQTGVLEIYDYNRKGQVAHTDKSSI